MSDRIEQSTEKAETGRSQTPAGGHEGRGFSVRVDTAPEREVAAAPPAGRTARLVCRVLGHRPRLDVTSWGVFYGRRYCSRCLVDLPRKESSDV